MALKKCQECGGSVSSKASSCPHCGAAMAKKRSGCGTFLIVLFVLGFFGAVFRGPSTAPQSTPTAKAPAPAAPAKSAEQLRKERIEKAFSAWDGSHRGLSDYVKKNMNDPDSFSHVETTYWDKGDHLRVRMSFRGKNAFGAVVKQTIIAKTSLEGTVLSIESQNN